MHASTTPKTYKLGQGFDYGDKDDEDDGSLSSPIILRWEKTSLKKKGI